MSSNLSNVVPANAATLFSFNSTGVSISQYKPLPPDGTQHEATASRYFVLIGTADLTLASYTFASAEIYLSIDNNGFTFYFDASLALGPLGSVDAQGTIDISSAGLIVDASLTGTLGLAPVLTFSGGAALEINTTNATSTTTDKIPPQSAGVYVHGAGVGQQLHHQRRFRADGQW